MTNQPLSHSASPAPKEPPKPPKHRRAAEQTKPPKLPFEGDADEHASKSDFPGQRDNRTNQDRDGNGEQTPQNGAPSRS